jgi:hypothetical protein
MSRRNARPVTLVASVFATVLAVLAAPADARAQAPAPTSMPGCLYFVPSTTWSPPHCVREHPEPGPLDGLNTVGVVGASMTAAGVGATAMGIAIAYGGSQGRTADEGLMLAGGVTAGIGILLIAVGAPLWVHGGEDGDATKVGIGPGSVNVAGTF